MAFREQSSSANAGATGSEGFFNINQAVGWYEVGTRQPAANLCGDMMLTAYFLQYIFRYYPFFRRTITDREVEQIPVPMEIPSKLSSQRKALINDLAFWIGHYQKVLKKHNTQIFVDSRVDRARGTFTTMTKSKFTIHCLNTDFADVMRTFFYQDDWQLFVVNDNYAPSLLKLELSRTA